MEWSKDKTLKLIELLQVNPNNWNPAISDSRRYKQKRKEDLRTISELFGISVQDANKKIQHLRTQYNRESHREERANAEDPNDRYVSNWYAFEYLHFMKDSSKPYRILREELSPDSNNLPLQSDNSISECKLTSLSPPHKIARTDSFCSVQLEACSSTSQNRDEFTVFGEYIANELRSLKGEKNLLVAKKKIQDVIFEVKMGMICDPKPEENTSYTVEAHTNQPQNATAIHRCSMLPLAGKLYSSPMSTTTHIEPLATSHTPPTSSISEIIISAPCHYTNFKVE